MSFIRIDDESLRVGTDTKERGDRIMIKQDYRILNWDTTILGKPTEMTASIEYIDKTKASALLLLPYGQQRSLTKSMVEKLAQAMNANEFIDAIVNPIFISNTGKLLDGQHRLTALTHTNKTIPFLVVRGLPEETFVYFDQNKPRAAKDALKVRGVRNADKVAIVTKLIYHLLEGKSSVPRNEVLDRMVEDYPAIESAVAKAESMGDTTHIITSVGATLYFMYSIEYPEIYSRFFELLQYGGEEMKNGKHPVTRLVKKLNEEWKKSGGRRMQTDFWTARGANGLQKTYDTRYKVMSYIHRAFMAYATGKHSFSWETDTLSTIDSISQMCRRNIAIRNSYNSYDNLPF